MNVVTDIGWWKWYERYQ